MSVCRKRSTFYTDYVGTYTVRTRGRISIRRKLPGNAKPIVIPIEVLQDRDLSAMEAIVWYLKEEQGLTYSQIASMLNRDDRTVWTTYKRATKKVVRQ